MTSMPLLRTVPLLLLAALLASCTTQAWYEGARAHAEAECRKQPPGSYEDCMSHVNRQTYDDYDKERKPR